eukprot:425961-Pleurochrysis_carterae.AAC.1
MRRGGGAGGKDDDEGDDDDDDDDNDDGSDEDAFAQKLRLAKYLDYLFARVYAVRLFERDNRKYREERAVALFNTA